VNDFFIDGFEIDNNGNFYFLGGDKSISLAVFSGSQLIYRARYKNISTGVGQLYFSRNVLYTFNRLSPNKLFLINPINGVIIKAYENKVSEKINSYTFTGNNLIIQSLSDSKIIYNQYTLTVKRIRQAVNKYNLLFNIPNDVQFLGNWKDKFVFYMISGRNFEKQRFYVTDKSGKILAQRILANDNLIFGDGYAENPPEDRKVRNGNLYVLGRKSNFALITEIPLQNFFGLRWYNN